MNYYNPDLFERMKSDWHNTFGQLIKNNPNIIKPTYIREDNGELLDCSGLYAFKLNNVLFMGLDVFITEAWSKDKTKILTRTSQGVPIYVYDDWILGIRFFD